jgi:hypothetical protein
MSKVSLFLKGNLSAYLVACSMLATLGMYSVLLFPLMQVVTAGDFIL